MLAKILHPKRNCIAVCVFKIEFRNFKSTKLFARTFVKLRNLVVLLWYRVTERSRDALCHKGRGLAWSGRTGILGAECVVVAV